MPTAEVNRPYARPEVDTFGKGTLRKDTLGDKTMNPLRWVIFILCLGCGSVVIAAEAKPYLYIPTTVSPQAAERLKRFSDPAERPSLPGTESPQAWAVVQRQAERAALNRQRDVVDRLATSVREMHLGGIPVLEVKPEGWEDNGKVMVYAHGGGYVTLSAKSSLVSASLMANATGLRVISIDYTLAPQAGWRQVTGEVVRAIQALLDEGYAMGDIAIYGDSAGGGLAAAAVLKMRDSGMGMPAAVVLWSPLSDVTGSGDSFTTLRYAEPFYDYDRHLKPAVNAYADPEEHRHPYVSPVYADYHRGFPPTLIQGGTKEIFLSNFVRHYQALDVAGQTVKLDLYEGMVHVFQVHLAGTPESRQALKKTAVFVEQHLGD